MLAVFGNGSKNKVSTVSRFGGYSRRAAVYENEITDMQNMDSDSFPALSVRKKRRTAYTLKKPNGLYCHDGLFWVDGTTLYRSGKAICTVEDSRKTFVSMGAYLIIQPDGIVVNTTDNSYAYMDCIHDVQAEVTMRFCDMNGENTQEPLGYLKLFLPPSFLSVNDFIELYDCDEKLAGWHRVTAVSLGDPNYTVIDYNYDAMPENTVMKIRRDYPHMDHLVSVENRLWGCSSANHELYASGPGSPFNWHRFEGISTDSYAATVGSQGDFTGAVTMYSYAFFFKEGCIHKVYGSKPSEFVITENTAKGIANGSERSIAYVKGGVCYLGTDGFYFYQGSTPMYISEALGSTRYYNAVGGAIGNKYYVSAYEETSAVSGSKTGTAVLLCYDFDTGLWSKIDNTRVIYFAVHGNLMYALTEKGEILCFDDGEECFGVGDSSCEDEVEWYAVFEGLLTKPYTARYLKRIYCDIDVVAGSAAFEVSYDDGIWIYVCETSATGRQTVSVPCVPARCSDMKLRIRGGGKAVIFSLSKEYEEGGGL